MQVQIYFDPILMLKVSVVILEIKQKGVFFALANIFSYWRWQFKVTDLPKSGDAPPGMKLLTVVSSKKGWRFRK